METTPWGRFKSAALRIEARMDCWAKTRLTPEEFAEAVELDRALKRDFGKWSLYFLAACSFGGLLVMGLAPTLHPGHAFLIAAGTLLYIAFCVTSAWFGYRKWAHKPPLKVVGIFVGIMLCGLAAGFLGTLVVTGKPMAGMSWEKLARGSSIALLIGLGLASMFITIAQLRKREVLQKAARLEAEAERERLARHSAQAELKLLQAQVEPHFLFNTLANLRHLVQVGSPDAVTMLDHLIHYLRTALPELRTETSTLAREAELARAYLEILRIRMGGALAFSIDVPEDMARQPFPPLMLITLVENAVKHGVAPQGRGRIEVRATQQGERVRVAVEDDGRGLQEPIGQGVGLASIRERLRALFGATARLELEGREGGGTRATIEVPA